MASYKAGKIRKALAKKGFAEHSSKHVMLFYYHKGKKTSIHTEVSHGSKEIGEYLIACMKDQLRLTKDQFCKVVECTISKEALEKIYEENGALRVASSQPGQARA